MDISALGRKIGQTCRGVTMQRALSGGPQLPPEDDDDDGMDLV